MWVELCVRIHSKIGAISLIQQQPEIELHLYFLLAHTHLLRLQATHIHTYDPLYGAVSQCFQNKQNV